MPVEFEARKTFREDPTVLYRRERIDYRPITPLGKRKGTQHAHESLQVTDGFMSNGARRQAARRQQIFRGTLRT